MAKKVLVALPDGLITEIDALAKREFRTRSDLMREALRRYIDVARREFVKTVSLAEPALATEQVAVIVPSAIG